MAALLEWLKGWIEALIGGLGYPGIVLVMAIENLFPPIPSELVLPFAGFLVNDGTFTLVGVVIAGTLGSTIGALMLYGIGHWANERIIRRFVRAYGRWFLLDETDIDNTLAFFARYGQAAIFIGRLVPIVRSLISIPAGMQGMPLGTFLVFTIAGTAIWSALLAYFGMILGQNWPLVIEFVERYQRVIIVVVAIGLVTFVGLRLRRLWLRRTT